MAIRKNNRAYISRSDLTGNLTYDKSKSKEKPKEKTNKK